MLKPSLLEMTLYGFQAALVAQSQLCIGLFEVDVFIQQKVVVELFFAGKKLVANRTFISLFAVFSPVLDERVLLAKWTFLTNIGKKSLKTLYGKDSSDFYQPKCPLSLFSLYSAKLHTVIQVSASSSAAS